MPENQLNIPATPRNKSALLLHLPDNTHLREPRTNPSRNLAVTMPNDPEVPYVPPARLISGSLTALQVTAMFEGLSFPSRGDLHLLIPVHRILLQPSIRFHLTRARI